MVSDATTFFAGFAAVFGALGYYLWHLERKVNEVAQRLAELEVTPEEP